MTMRKYTLTFCSVRYDEHRALAEMDVRAVDKWAAETLGNAIAEHADWKSAYVLVTAAEDEHG